LKTRLITNIRLLAQRDGEAEVESKFLLWQSRWDGAAATFVGRRRDLLRESGSSWRIARREIYLGTTILPRSLTVFF
jgi:3-phenylpropionate/cinnamic acid dioxygenase small subunit